jgi:ribulose bisphosphate carboxylase small subunit
MRRSRTQAVHQLQQRIAQGERLLKEFTDRREPETERVRSLLRAELERKRMALRAIRAGRV